MKSRLRWFPFSLQKVISWKWKCLSWKDFIIVFFLFWKHCMMIVLLHYWGPLKVFVALEPIFMNFMTWKCLQNIFWLQQLLLIEFVLFVVEDIGDVIFDETSHLKQWGSGQRRFPSLVSARSLMAHSNAINRACPHPHTNTNMNENTNTNRIYKNLYEYKQKSKKVVPASSLMAHSNAVNRAGGGMSSLNPPPIMAKGPVHLHCRVAM